VCHTFQVCCTFWCVALQCCTDLYVYNTPALALFRRVALFRCVAFLRCVAIFRYVHLLVLLHFLVLFDLLVLLHFLGVLHFLVCSTPALYRFVCIYGVATVSRIDKIVGLFCKRAL